MNRMITIKGVGSIHAKPDWVVVPITSTVKHKEHDEAMRKGERALEQIRSALSHVGFDKADIKTLNFGITPEFDYVRDSKGNSKRVFTGYQCQHALKIEFPLETSRLSAVLSALGKCEAKPEFNVQFTVKDQEALKDEMLRSASADARRKASILCEASNVSLGQLISIDYSWQDVTLYSNSRMMLAEPAAADCEESCLDIEPDDIRANDTVTFIWEIQ